MRKIEEMLKNEKRMEEKELESIDICAVLSSHIRVKGKAPLQCIVKKLYKKE